MQARENKGKLKKTPLLLRIHFHTTIPYRYIFVYFMVAGEHRGFKGFIKSSVVVGKLTFLVAGCEKKIHL